MNGWDVRPNVDFRVSMKNGVQLTVDIDAPNGWHYVAVGVTKDRLEVRHGHAPSGELPDWVVEMAHSEGMNAHRYAAGHTQYIDDVLDIPLTE